MFTFACQAIDQFYTGGYGYDNNKRLLDILTRVRAVYLSKQGDHKYNIEGQEYHASFGQNRKKRILGNVYRVWCCRAVLRVRGRRYGARHVFEEYRGNGYAKELYSFLIDWQLKRGRIPYGQVFQDNEASIALQKSFGLTFSKEPVYWLWK